MMTTRFLLLFALLAFAAANEDDNEQRGSLRRSLTYINKSIDGRWKSKKLTQKQKEAMGLFPPPGEKWPDDPPELSVATATAVDSSESGTMTVIDTVEEEEKLEEVVKSEEQKVVAPNGNRRSFISYTPSKFEEVWTANIEKYVGKKRICRAVIEGKHQKVMMQLLMDFLCTAPLEGTDWCYWHDHQHYVWYNKGNNDLFEVFIDKTPPSLKGVAPPSPTEIRRDDGSGIWDDVASKFTFLDESTGEIYHEYIEPLVTHLNFPLAGCLEDPVLKDFASFIIPPPSLERVGGRTLMFDVGSSDWTRMEYIVEEWEARGAGISVLNSYSTSGDEVEDAFLTSVPEHHKSKIFRHFMKLVDFPVPDKDKVFVPRQIQQEAHPNDYVMVKLDHANALLKQGLLEHFLHSPDAHVDELFWEINSRNNYLMLDQYMAELPFEQIADLTLPDAYKMLQALRHKGIRAHAWI